MDKQELTNLINKGNYSQEKLLGWVGALPSTGSSKPSYNKVGDVLMHNVFKHPYILLEKKKDHWVAGLLTTEGNCPEILEKCQSRFFENSLITKALFTVTEIQGTFLNNYDNPKHLKEVLNKIKLILK